jgi:hypothetical protein
LSIVSITHSFSPSRDGDFIDATPNVQLLPELGAAYSPAQAIAEYIDNSIESYVMAGAFS